jgi:hypothetical protein
MKCAFFENRECDSDCKAYYTSPDKPNTGSCARLIIQLPTDNPTLML